MKNRRIYNRIHSYAKAVFLFYDLIGYVRDISEEGLRIELVSDEIPEFSGTAHTTIISHPDLKLDPFNILTEIRWAQRNGPTIAVGLRVIEFSSSQGEEIFSRLVQLFAELNSQSD
ncbi:MAG: PilZ domain-containing protein [Sediminispirochaetaceae bacterium]